jgi:hypothetical protein
LTGKLIFAEPAALPRPAKTSIRARGFADRRRLQQSPASFALAGRQHWSRRLSSFLPLRKLLEENWARAAKTKFI